MTDRLVSDERIKQIAERIGTDATLRSDELGCGDIERAIRQAVQESGEAAAKVAEALIERMKLHTNPDGIVTGSDFYFSEIATLEDCAAEIRKRLPKPPE